LNDLKQEVDKGLAHALKNAVKIERKPPPPKKRKDKK
jgi:hypothetical protein